MVASVKVLLGLLSWAQLVANWRNAAAHWPFCLWQGRTMGGSNCDYRSKLDLSPAVDRFVKLPSSAELKNSVVWTLNSTVANSIEPFKLVANDLAPLSSLVKDLVKNEHPVLIKASLHFFNQV